jgi:hypothetical protein
MVQIVVLSATGEHKTVKTTAFAGGITGATVAKAIRKTKPASLILTYKYSEATLTVWGWTEGKAGTENKHELPPSPTVDDPPLLFGDAIVTASDGDFTAEEYLTFYEEAMGGFEETASSDEEDLEEEAEEEEEEEAVEDEEVEEKEEVEEEEEEAEEEEAEAEEEEEDADDDCYDDGDEMGGAGKRRPPRRRAISAPEYRRVDMGLRARVKLPAQPGKRAPRWQTGPELEEEEYSE